MLAIIMGFLCMMGAFVSCHKQLKDHKSRIKTLEKELGELGKKLEAQAGELEVTRIKLRCLDTWGGESTYRRFSKEIRRNQLRILRTDSEIGSLRRRVISLETK